MNDIKDGKWLSFSKLVKKLAIFLIRKFYTQLPSLQNWSIEKMKIVWVKKCHMSQTTRYLREFLRVTYVKIEAALYESRFLIDDAHEYQVRHDISQSFVIIVFNFLS